MQSVSPGPVVPCRDTPRAKPQQRQEKCFCALFPEVMRGIRIPLHTLCVVVGSLQRSLWENGQQTHKSGIALWGPCTTITARASEPQAQGSSHFLFNRHNFHPFRILRNKTDRVPGLSSSSRPQPTGSLGRGKGLSCFCSFLLCFLPSF